MPSAHTRRNFSLQVKYARRTPYVGPQAGSKNKSMDTLSSLEDEPNTLVGYGELPHPSYITLEPCYDSNGNPIVSREDWWKSKSTSSSPVKYGSPRSSIGYKSRTCSSSSLASLSLCPVSRGSSGVFKEEDPFDEREIKLPFDPTFERAGRYSKNHDVASNHKHHGGQTSTNSFHAFYHSTKLDGSNKRNWEHIPGSSSSGPHGPSYEPTFIGDRGFERVAAEIKVDLPTPRYRTVTSADLDGLFSALSTI